MKKHNRLLMVIQIVIILFTCISLFVMKPVPLEKDTINENKIKELSESLKYEVIQKLSSHEHTYWFTLSKQFLDQHNLTEDDIYKSIGFYPLQIEQNFNYRIRKGKNVEEISWPDKMMNNPLVYITYTFDHNGNLKIYDHLNNQTYAEKDNLFFIEQNVEELLYNFDNFDHYDIKDAYQMKYPKDVSFDIYLAPTILNNLYLRSILIDDGKIFFAIIIYMTISILGLIAFALFTPFEKVKQSRFYMILAQFKAEFVFIFFVLMFFIVGYVSAVLSYLMMTSILIYDIRNIMTLTAENVNTVIMLIRFIIAFIFYVLFNFVFYSMFYIKSIFKKGMKVFFVEDTLIGSCLYKIKNYNYVQFNNKFYFILSVVLLINLVIMIFCAQFSYILFIVYSVFLFLFIHYQYKKMKCQYDRIYEMSKLLANGQFGDVKDADVSIFQSLYDELLNTKDGFAKALEEGIKSQDMKTELISNVSHDLKTPLTGLKNYVELLQNETDPIKMKDYIEKVSNYTNRLDHLVVDLFDVSKANSKAIDVNYNICDICAFIQQVQAEYAENWLQKGLQSVYTMPDHEVKVSIDPDKMVRVFENIIQNIERYTLENTRVFIDVVEDAEKVYIIYKNISKAPLNFNTEDICERFVRGDKSRHEIGSGLGLAIIKSFTELQQGSFEIQIDGDMFKQIITFHKMNDEKIENKELEE